jgi:hypothetical protein
MRRSIPWVTASRRWPLAAVIALVTCPAPALAQSDAATAESFFEQARKLMAEKRFDEACPLLAESHRLDPGGGTLLNLALCHEEQGKTATAWGQFKEALAIARRDRRQERIDFAEQHIRALEPRLSHLQIEVGEAPPNMVVKIDGMALGSASWGRPLPIDPGKHRVEAEAPGHQRWEAEVEIGASADRQTLTVPPLVPLPESSTGPVETPAPKLPSPAPTMTEERDGVSTQAIIGYSVGALGLVGVIVGAGFGIRAIDLDGDADDVCSETACPDTLEGRTALQQSQDARSSATVANGLVSAGAGLLVAGLIVVLTAPSEGGKEAATALRLEPTSSGLRLRW